MTLDIRQTYNLDMDRPIALSGAAHRRNRSRRPASLKKRIKTWIAVTFLVLMLVFSAAAIFLMNMFVQVTRGLPSIADIGNFRPAESTKIYFSDGPLMAVLATENRRPVKLADISRKLVDATIAVEDARFYEHKGVDYIGIGRALYRNVTGGRILNGEGGSTITQQLARNISALGLTKEKKVRRKVAEAVLAVRIEQTFDKDEILELYLNQIYYGNGAYGVDAAARTYLHKSSKDVSLAEAAMLAGLPQSPSRYSNNHDAARRRQHQVLKRMLDTAKITRTEYDNALRETVKIYKAEPRSTQVFGAPYFVNWIVGKLVRDFGVDSVYSGWTIYTTLDSRMQAAAEESLRRGIREYGSANQGALVSIDPRTGYIRAMVGGVDFKRDQFNAVVQGKRQPGSTFKPIVYLAGLDTRTIELDSTFVDSPDFPGRNPRQPWKPKNYSGKYSFAPMSVLSAIKYSVNTVAVKVAMETRLKTVIDYAHRLGITSEIPPYPPIALGAAAVRPLELASAYTVFANGGKRAVPMGIKRVVAASGEDVGEVTPKLEELGLRPEAVQQMDKALREAVLYGTGTAASPIPEARGKTGTTSDAIDAWFAGYTPDLVTVIWVAREKRLKDGRLDPKHPYLEMPGATGGAVCAPIWRDYMQKAGPLQQAFNNAGGRTAATVTPPETKFDQAPLRDVPNRPTPLLTTQENRKPAEDSTEVPAEVPTTQVPETPDGPTTSRPGGDAASPASPRTIAPPAPTLTIPSTTPGGRAASGGSVRRTSGAVAAEPSGGIVEPGGRPTVPAAPKTDPNEEVISVRVCADSLALATRWCDATIERRVRRRDTPRRCRTHRPPPGEPDN